MSELAPQTLLTFPRLTDPDAFDVIIIGGGPAGMSAALVLARCRRKVLVVDSGKPRNRSARNMHGFLTRDGLPPNELARLSREELLRYPTVVITNGTVVDGIALADSRFIMVLEDGRRYLSRKVLLATGVQDELPDIPGLLDLYGSSVHHCPICDGYEWRDKAIAVYGKNCRGFGLVQEMTAWSRDLLLLTDGPCDFPPNELTYLQSMRIQINHKPVRALEGSDGQLKAVLFDDGTRVDRDALFFTGDQTLHSHDLPTRLGCRITENHTVWVGQNEMTCVEGVYCCGDASRNAQMVIVAAAEGAVAAVAINKALTLEYKEAKRQQHEKPSADISVQ